MAKVTFEDVKLFLNDFPEVNQFLNESEFSVKRVLAAIHYVIDEWNSTPPRTNLYTEDTFPYKNTLLMGVASFLFSGQTAFKERNHLTYQSGGLVIDEDNQAPTYANLARFFQDKYQTLMEKQKHDENISGGWGIVGSGYYD